MSSDQPIVFLSYSHRDEHLKERLEKHLKVLRGRLDVWEDRRLRAGEDWFEGISKAMASAHAAVLLISADFLTSDFILNEEVPKLLKRRAEEGVAIIPVVLSPCLWEEIPWLSALQVRLVGARPITTLADSDREQALADIAREVFQLATEQQKRRATETTPPKSEDPPSQDLAQQLESTYQRLEEVAAADGDTSQLRETILDLKRRLREDGQLKPGDVLGDGRYRLLKIVGRGGFSTVYKAFDRRSRVDVAVKVLHAQLAQDERRRQRFFLGARKMGELQHQAVVRVIEPEGQDGGYHYFVMEYVDGGDLRQAVKSGAIRGVKGLTILEEVAKALDLAHRQGLVHRDVKPANILLTQGGQAKLSDFDLVRALDTTLGTRTSSSMGTVLYMAPEAMLEAENAEAPADIYSLGMCAAFVLHGKEIPGTFLRDYRGFFDRLEAAEVLKSVLLRATAMDPEERHASAGELWRALSDAAESAAKETSTSGVATDEPKEPQRSPAARKRFDTQAPLKTSYRTNKERLASPHHRARQFERVMSKASPGDSSPEPWAHDLGSDRYGMWASFKVNDVEQRMRWIRSGAFTMGSPKSELGRASDEGPAHSVTLTKGFWLADTPCPQALWEAVMGDNPSRYKSPQQPVERVSWKDCQRFIERLNGSVPGLELRLPTEAEWEYACRAGKSTATWSGDLDSGGRSSILDPIAWYGDSQGGGAQEVAQKAANPWGLYDMLGNVYEWCLDGPRSYSEEAVTDPVGPEEGSLRVLRGGSWYSFARLVRSACRSANVPGFRYDFLGFRLALGPVRGAQ